MIFEIEVKDALSAKEFIQNYNRQNFADLDIVGQVGAKKLTLSTTKLSEMDLITFAIAFGNSEEFLNTTRN